MSTYRFRHGRNRRVRARPRRGPLLACAGALLVAAIAAARAAPDGEPFAPTAPVAEPTFGVPEALARANLPALQALVDRATVGPDGRMRARLEDGSTATLSVDPVLQRKLARLLRDYAVPAGVTVAVEPATGRILAYAAHAAEAAPETWAVEPLAPAASVFKLVTGAALLEAGVRPEERVCYSGGLRGVRERHLAPDATGGRCHTMAEAMGHSANVPFARLAAEHLTPEALRRTARRLLFGSGIEVDGEAYPPSLLEIPGEGLEFARTAAGFNRGVRLTPLHGALLAATVANGGVAPALRLVDERDGEPVPLREGERLLSPEIARRLGEMMELTVSEGTARAAFLERRRPALPGVRVAGKTGSLFEREPFRDATWFVGFAPAEAPEIAVASVIVNGGVWRIRAPYVAREALRSHLLGTMPYRPR